MNKSVFDQPDNFTNRELSWLEFNQRILGEARDRKNPLFERMKFLSITAGHIPFFPKTYDRKGRSREHGKNNLSLLQL